MPVDRASRKPYGMIILGLVIGLVVGFGISALSGIARSPGELVIISKEAAGQAVVDWLAANDMPATLLVVAEESRLYKVTVKANATGVASDFYVTQDGEMLFQPGIADLNATTNALLARRGWFECLGQRGLRMFGSTETNSTLLQLQVFGGAQFVDRIYVGCEGERAQACVDAGISEVPTFVYGNQSWTGVKTLDWFVNLTGCVPVA